MSSSRDEVNPIFQHSALNTVSSFWKLSKYRPGVSKGIIALDTVEASPYVFAAERVNEAIVNHRGKAAAAKRNVGDRFPRS